MNLKKNALLTRTLDNHLMAIAIGFVYIWFGTLKFFPGISPAEELGINTIHRLTQGLLSDTAAIYLLAALEVVIGLFLVLNLFKRQILYLAIGHIVFTFTPLLFFPSEAFQWAPLVPTLLGQYIGKNVIVLCALITLIRMDQEGIVKKKSKDRS